MKVSAYKDCVRLQQGFINLVQSYHMCSCQYFLCVVLLKAFNMDLYACIIYTGTFVTTTTQLPMHPNTIHTCQ